MLINHPKLVLDACCLINLHVSGRLGELIRALPVRVAVSEIVWEQEVPTLRRALDEGLGGQGGAYDTQRGVAEGLIDVLQFQSDEADAFVEYAAELRDDGESATCAIAFARRWAIATDDRAAIRLIERRAPETQVVTTPELVKHWVESTDPSPEAVRRVIERIQEIGRYQPPRSHPLWAWWDGAQR